MNDQNEPTVLLAKGAAASSENVSKLAMAMTRSINECGYVDVQAIGPPAISNAIKAYIKSKNHVANDDNAIELVCQFAYQKPEIDGKVITAIRMRVFPISSKLVIPSNTNSVLLMAKGAAAGPENIVRLSQAITQSLSETSNAGIQSIGPSAINNTIKAYIKAKGVISEYVNGLVLVCKFSYHTPEIDGKPVTAVRANIFAIPAKHVK